MNKGNRLKAFTLAEVLITLGIIGVVAAITLPNLIQNFQKKQTAIKVKKEFAVLNNAIDRAKVDYGTDIQDWEMLNTGSIYSRSVHFANMYIIPYLNIIDKCENENSENCKYTTYFMDGRINLGYTDFKPLILNDGTIIFVGNLFNSYLEDETITRPQIYFDINGKQRPNVMGKDIFKIEIGGLIAEGHDYNKFLPYGYSSNSDCDFYTTTTLDQACRKEAGYHQGFCLAALMCNGWEFPKNYPW